MDVLPGLVHFAFSTGFAVVYCVLAECFPQVKLWQGAAFGILVSSGLTSCSCPPRASSLPPWNQPFAEHFSEFFGHIIWMRVIEVHRRGPRGPSPPPGKRPTARTPPLGFPAGAPHLHRAHGPPRAGAAIRRRG